MPYCAAAGSRMGFFSTLEWHSVEVYCKLLGESADPLAEEALCWGGEREPRPSSPQRAHLTHWERSAGWMACLLEMNDDMVTK